MAFTILSNSSGALHPSRYTGATRHTSTASTSRPARCAFSTGNAQTSIGAAGRGNRLKRKRSASVGGYGAKSMILFMSMKANLLAYNFLIYSTSRPETGTLPLN